jgi:hypothetical protein
VTAKSVSSSIGAATFMAMWKHIAIFMRKISRGIEKRAEPRRWLRWRENWLKRMKESAN